MTPLNWSQSNIHIWLAILVGMLQAQLTIKKVHFAEFKQVFEQLIAQMDAELFHAVLWTDGELPPEAFHLHTVEMLQH